MTPVDSPPCDAASLRCFGRGLSKREETNTVLEQQHSGRVFTLRADLRPGRRRKTDAVITLLLQDLSRQNSQPDDCSPSLSLQGAVFHPCEEDVPVTAP